jgi:hypothetical protein
MATHPPTHPHTHSTAASLYDIGTTMHAHILWATLSHLRAKVVTADLDVQPAQQRLPVLGPLRFLGNHNHTSTRALCLARLLSNCALPPHTTTARRATHPHGPAAAYPRTQGHQQARALRHERHRRALAARDQQRVDRREVLRRPHLRATPPVGQRRAVAVTVCA